MEENSFREHFIKKQEIEDNRFYNHIKGEAMRQINRPEGWVIDISRARLMQIYEIYDEESAKYKDVNSLELCNSIIDSYRKK